MRRSVRLVAVLGALTAFGPLTMDLYLPGLPDLAKDLGTTAGSAQVTVTACVIGLAIGQVLSGPIGDATGRRRPLLAGLAVFTAASVGCALASSIGMLDALRAVQGLAGAAGITLARAMVRDTHSGLDAARMYSTLAAVMGVAPILAPLVGAVLLLVGDWRALFLFLAVVGAVLLAATAAWTQETLAPERRAPGHAGHIARTHLALLRDRAYMRYTVPLALGTTLIFGYLTASSFVYQDVYGLSPQAYGLLFGANGVLLMASSVVNRHLLERVSQERLLVIGLVLMNVGATALAAAALAGAGAAAVIPLVFAACYGMGMVNPNATALGLADQHERAGSASGVMGLLQFAAGAAVPPIFALIGTSASTMALVMEGGALLALVTLALLSGERRGGPAPAGAATGAR